MTQQNKETSLFRDLNVVGAPTTEWPPPFTGSAAATGEYVELTSMPPPAIMKESPPPALPTASGNPGFLGAFRELLRDVRDVDRSMRMMYLIFWLFMVSAFGFSYVVMNYLVTQLGLGNQRAGWVYGWRGIISSVMGFIAGPIIDRLGFKPVMCVGLAFMVVAKMTMVWVVDSQVKGVGVSLFSTKLAPVSDLLAPSLFPHPSPTQIGLAMYLTLFTTGISLSGSCFSIAVMRYVPGPIQKSVYQFLYVLANVSAVIVYNSITIIESTSSDVIPTIIFLTACCDAVCLILALFQVRNATAAPESMGAPQKQSGCSMWGTLRDMLWYRPLWILFGMNVTLIFVRAINGFMNNLYPLYMARAFWPVDPHAATIMSIDPLTVVVLFVPLATMFRWTDPYKMMVLGSAISALGLLFMLAGAHIWAVVLFVVMITMGEIIYLPAGQAYGASLAPVGREGLFLSITGIPSLANDLFVGIVSGYLLETYCPALGVGGCPRPAMLWTILTLIVMPTPILLLIMSPWFNLASEPEPMAINEPGDSMDTVGEMGKPKLMTRPKMLGSPPPGAEELQPLSSSPPLIPSQ